MRASTDVSVHACAACACHNRANRARVARCRASLAARMLPATGGATKLKRTREREPWDGASDGAPRATTDATAHACTARARHGRGTCARTARCRLCCDGRIPDVTGGATRPNWGHDREPWDCTSDGGRGHDGDGQHTRRRAIGNRAAMRAGAARAWRWQARTLSWLHGQRAARQRLNCSAPRLLRARARDIRQ